MKILLSITKKMTLLAFALVVAGSAFAQTDVTSTYLTNADFNTTANYKFDDEAANLASANGGANIKEVTGWTRGLIGDNSAAATFEYGYTGTINVSTTFGFIPATGPDGASGTGQAALGISTAWSGTVTYTQDVTLPAGKYSIAYTAYNSGPNAANLSRVGFAPTSGTASVSTRTSFTMAAWVNDTVTFTLYATTPGKIQVGIGSANVGSGSVGRIFFDHVKILAHPANKVVLVQLIDSANVIVADPKPVGTSTAYADLSAAITAAQTVNNNASASASQVLEQEGLLRTAITKVHEAIKIQERVAAWTTLPYNATSLILNPSFETGNTTSWVNVGGFVGQSNTSFPFKQGTFYVERWKSSGNWTGLKLSQKITALPNGIYSVTAGALNNPGTTGGAFIFANAVRAEIFTANDYTVLVTVTNNEIELGYEVVNGGNYVAVDNFRLSYISDGSPYMVAAPEKLFFDPLNLVKTFTITGGNLTQNATISAPAGVSLDITTLTPAQVASGATITATFDNLTTIASGNIVAITGSVTDTIQVMASADLSCYVPAYTSEATNLVPNPYLNDISGFGGWGKRTVVYGSEAYCGLGAVKFAATTNGWPDGAALDVPNVQWQPNSTYRVRAMVKAVDGTVAFFAKGTDPDVTIMVPQTNDQWIQIDTLFSTGAAPAPNFFSINNVDGGSTALTVYIDNYELYLAPLGTSVANPIAVDAPYAYNNNGNIAVRFSLDESAEVSFSVYNMQGMLMTSQKGVFNVGTNNAQLNAANAGVYIVQMNVNGKVYTNKLVL